MENVVKSVSLVDIQKFFKIPVTLFRKEWSELTPEDKAQIKQGLSDGTFTY